MAKSKKSGKKSRITGERREALMRIPIGLVSGVLLYVWGYLVVVLAIVHWILTLVTNERNKDIADFIEYWNSEAYVFYRYLTGVSNERPFPFNALVRVSEFK